MEKDPVAGVEATKNMIPVHGRTAYYGKKSLGHLDGGAVVGKLIFEALWEMARRFDSPAPTCYSNFINYRRRQEEG